MKTWIKVLIIFLLSFCVVFTSVGYAALTDELTIEGELIFIPPDYDEVIIKSIDSTTLGGGAESTDVWQILPTNLVSTVKFSSVGDTVTYTLTARNDSETIKYAYSDILCDASLQDYNGNAYYNNGITITVKKGDGSDLKNTAIEPGATLQFTAEYKLTDQSLIGVELKTMLNYKFGVHIDSAGDAAIGGATETFENILNDEIKLNDLLSKMETNEKDYIGNVAGGDTTDSQFVAELFGENLSIITADGTKTDVTCIIKKKQITVGNTTKDAMIIYMTAEEITGRTGLFGSGGETISVFAMVYVPAVNSSDTYVPYGEMYYGTATTNDYEGAWFADCNSFNTETWESSAQSYSVPGYAYSISAGQTIDQILSITVSATALNTLYAQLDSAKAINPDSYSASQELKDNLAYAIEHAENIKANVQNGYTIYQAEFVVALRSLVESSAPFMQ